MALSKKSQLQFFNSYLDSLVEQGRFTAEHISTVKQLWNLIEEKTDGKLRMARSLPMDNGSLRLSWKMNEKTFNADVHSNIFYWSFLDGKDKTLKVSAGRLGEISEEMMNCLLELIEGCEPIP